MKIKAAADELFSKVAYGVLSQKNASPLAMRFIATPRPALEKKYIGGVVISLCAAMRPVVFNPLRDGVRG